jgi:hypothetical protein
VVRADRSIFTVEQVGQRAIQRPGRTRGPRGPTPIAGGAQRALGAGGMRQAPVVQPQPTPVHTQKPGTHTTPTVGAGGGASTGGAGGGGALAGGCGGGAGGGGSAIATPRALPARPSGSFQKPASQA